MSDEDIRRWLEKIEKEIDMIYYTLGGDDGHEVLATTDMLAWARWYHFADRKVEHTLTALHDVRTDFLGLDHRFLGDGPPITFETMVFERDDVGDSLLTLPEAFEGETWRYASWDDAVAGHRATVRRVLKAEEDAARVVAMRAAKE